LYLNFFVAFSDDDNRAVWRMTLELLLLLLFFSIYVHSYSNLKIKIGYFQLRTQKFSWCIQQNEKNSLRQKTLPKNLVISMFMWLLNVKQLFYFLLLHFFYFIRDFFIWETQAWNFKNKIRECPGWDSVLEIFKEIFSRILIK